MSRRHAISCALLLVLLLPSLGHADEREKGGAKKADPKAPWRMPAEEKADHFLKAFEGGDAARQAELGTGNLPDPWLVAEVLCNRGAHEAAAALARVAPDKSVDKLPAYIAARKAESPEATKAVAAATASLSAMRAAVDRKDIRALVAAAREAKGPGTSLSDAYGHLMRAMALRYMGRIPDSIAACDDGIKLAGEIGWHAGVISLQLSRGQSLFFGGDYKSAGRALRAAEKLARKIGNAALEASAISNQGNVLYGRAQYARALKHYEHAIELKQALGDKVGAARSLANVGTIYLTMGKISEALSALERAAEAFVDAGDMELAAMAVSNLGNAHARLGSLDAAVGYYDNALRASRSVGDMRGVAMTSLNMAVVWSRSAAKRGPGEKKEREADLKRVAKFLGDARPVAKEMNDVRMLMRIDLLGAALASDKGDHDTSLALSKDLLARASGARDVEMVLQSYRSISAALLAKGDLEEAATAAEQAVAEARRHRLNNELAFTLTALAQIRLAQGDNEAALRHATEGTQAAEVVMGQLSGDEAATAREQFASLFELGALAATRLDEVDEALRFMENGRAGAMLQQLGGRDALRWAMQKIPERLRDAEQRALQGESAARRKYESALRRRAPLARQRELGQELDLALDRVSTARSRIRRESMQQAGLFYPKAATTGEIQDGLEDGQVMVVYAPLRGETHAAVVTPDDEYLVKLPDWSDIYAQLKAASIDSAESSPAEGLAALRKALVDPLKLPKDTKEVIVSPALDLGYVPWGTLFDQPVALAPSASTHTLLTELDFDAAEGVLAVGDPDYAGVAASTRKTYARGQSLSPLPGSRAEAKAVGTMVLLGAAATPQALKVALAKQDRWRAAHFACHGLVDVNRPALCALALSQPKDQKDGNGFLTVTDVIGMDVPADIAVLSACETGRGRIVSGEGLRGLARAFMHAGAPRVVCSLWKVDDEATRALMVKFYELWNPKEGKGLPPALALKKAQEHVKSQKQWEHPYYWAAWVLWGLPR